MKVYDAVGTVIRPGNAVLYPVFDRGNVVMRRITVSRAGENDAGEVCVEGYRADTGRRVTIKKVENCVVVEKVTARFCRV